MKQVNRSIVGRRALPLARLSNSNHLRGSSYMVQTVARTFRSGWSDRPVPILSSICTARPARFTRGLATIPPIRQEDESPTWITDPTGTLSSEEQQELSAVVRELFEKYGVELSVLVEPTIPDPRLPSRARAIAVFNAWGIGSEQRNNGILIYMVLDRRRIEIVTGDGLSHEFPDLQVQQALEQRVIPVIHRAGKGAGLVEAANICADVLWKRYRLDPGGNWVFKDEKGQGPSADLSTVTTTYGSGGSEDGNGGSSNSHRIRNLAIIGAFLLAAYRLRELKDEYERRDKTCRHCQHYPMDHLESHDNTLSECNRVEEAIGSARFDQYYCPNCGHRSEVIRRETPGPFSKCDHCQCRSVTSHPLIRTPPAPGSTGIDVVHHECAICKRSANAVRVIPPLPAPGSAGSQQTIAPATGKERDHGGGGGHGGGSSSGGGAGASF